MYACLRTAYKGPSEAISTVREGQVLRSTGNLNALEKLAEVVKAEPTLPKTVLWRGSIRLDFRPVDRQTNLFVTLGLCFGTTAAGYGHASTVIHD